MSSRSKRTRCARLQELLAEMGKSFGKTTRWRVLCKDQNATSDAEKIKLAEQVLAEPPIDTVAGGHALWARLRGSKDRQAPPYKPTGY